MTRFFGLLSLLLAACAAGAGPAAAREPEHAAEWNAPAIQWRDIASGVRESSKTGKTVIMVFHATWCSSCKRYRSVWKDPAVVEASRNFVMILVDVDKDPDANGAFSPDGTYVPRTIFLNSEGDVLSSLRGKDPEFPHSLALDDPAELLGLMRKAPEGGAAPQDAPAADRRAEN